MLADDRRYVCLDYLVDQYVHLVERAFDTHQVTRPTQFDGVYMTENKGMPSCLLHAA